MGFYEILEERGMSSLLRRVEFDTPQFTNTKRFHEEMRTAIEKQKRILVIGDYDVDGLMSSLVLLEGLEKLGAKNVDVFPYRKRMHSLDVVAVQYCIQNKYDYCIIADCGSGSIGLLRKLTLYGVRVILLDHHMTMTSYDEFDSVDGLTVINTTLEPIKYCLSAGALCYCVIKSLCDSMGVTDEALSVYALISLYADCMDMHDELNRSIYYKATTLPNEMLPSKIAMFMNEYHTLSSRFINFWFSPKVNAMFRSERLDLLNRLFFDKNVTTLEIAEALREVEAVYLQAREMVLNVSDVMSVQELDTFVIGDLNSVSDHFDVKENKLWNYTGLVANKLSDRYSKAAVVYCLDDSGSIKGSVRDVFSRDFLSPFTQLCRAEGHKSAFGLRIHPLDLENTLSHLKHLDRKFSISEITNEPIVVEYPYTTPDTGLIEDIALVNEFASPGVPIVLLKERESICS